ncbi:unnamed protein product [Arabis nemorensis]|uniref:Uncharacterized protein n=1 Tax=Arabis nemorensis TaxID=586526 RepID=A0A565BNZ5_9BRAS|nr:unnamed protein product [Arabis nemorensis]
MSNEETNSAGTTGGGEQQQSPPVTVDTMPEAMTQIKAMLETLVKRIEDHDKQHATANARLETLAAAALNQTGGSGQDRPRRPFKELAPGTKPIQNL